MRRPCIPEHHLKFLPALVLPFVLGFVATIGCSRPPADPSTPEGVVRLYLEALKDGDISAAHSRLVPRLQAECTVDELKPRALEFIQALENASVVVRRTRIDGDSATVETSMNSGRADVGPFGPRPAGSWDQWYQLTKVGDEWRLSEYGWPVYGCPDSRPEKPVEPPAATPVPPTATPTARPAPTGTSTPLTGAMPSGNGTMRPGR